MEANCKSARNENTSRWQTAQWRRSWDKHNIWKLFQLKTEANFRLGFTCVSFVAQKIHVHHYLMIERLRLCSCGKDASRQPVDHGRPDAALSVGGGDRHGGLHTLQEEQGHLQNRALQELQDSLQGKTSSATFHITRFLMSDTLHSKPIVLSSAFRSRSFVFSLSSGPRSSLIMQTVKTNQLRGVGMGPRTGSEP